LAGGDSAVNRELRLDDLKLEDRWILGKLSLAVHETTSALEEFRYCEAAQRVRQIVRDEFCDWYLEAVKLRFAEGADAKSARCARGTLAHCMDVLLRLLHPVCPFITEELWHLLAEKLPDRRLSALGAQLEATEESIMVSSWPTAGEVPAALAESIRLFLGARHGKPDFSHPRRRARRGGERGTTDPA
jgi:valyl-tRNA synthetase